MNNATVSEYVPTVWDRIKWKWQMLTAPVTEKLRKSNTRVHAEFEFKCLDEGTVLGEFEDEILALVDKFGKSGQSGGSAPFVADVIKRCVYNLCMQRPIRYITGKSIEWAPSLGFNDNAEQNKRLSSVFRKDEDNLTAYYIDAVIFQGEDEWDTFSGMVDGVSSSQLIAFPFKPKTHYVDVYREEYDVKKHGEDARVIQGDSGDFVYFIKDMDQVVAAKNYCLHSCTENILKAASILGHDNGMSMRLYADIRLPEGIDWALLDDQIGILDDEELFTLITGEETDIKNIVKEYELQALNAVLNSMFDGKLSSVFFYPAKPFKQSSEGES